MKNETARREIEYLDYYLQNYTDDYSEGSHTAMMMAMKALEAQPSEDCISRQAVIDKATSWDTHFADSERYVSLSNIMALPSVTPQRPKGKWIKVDPLGMGDEAYMCSECKTGDWSITVHEYQYCPYCGAEMSGGDEDEDGKETN